MPGKLKTKQWTPSPFDGLHLAALRVYALQIERLCISIYASDSSQKTFPKMETLLAQTVKDLRKLGKQADATASSECADGYVMCADGLCHPPDTCS